MRALLFAGLLGTLASPSIGEDVRVLSGEHADFSRIVLVFQRPIEWSQTPVDGGFEVAFDRGDVSMNLEEVFTKIPRDRIQSVGFDQSRNVFKLEADCECALEVFDAGPNTVAIDVRTVNTPLPSPETSTADRSIGTPFPFGRPDGASYQVNLNQNGNELYRNAFDGLPEQKEEDGSLDTSGALNKATRSFEAVLFKQLGRVASQGLVELDSSGASSGSENSEDHLRPPHHERGSSHIRLGSVFDGDLVPIDPQSDIETEVFSCPDVTLFDFSQWSEDNRFSDAIATARSDLASQLDEPAPADVEKMAKTFIAFGFGAEARAVLSEYDLGLESSPLLLSMARIVDDEEVQDISALERSIECGDQSALWAFAAHEPQLAPPLSDVRPVQNAFIRLPNSLKARLGPKVVENLLAIGREGEAATVRNAIARLPNAVVDELKFIEATQAMKTGETDAAVTDLTELVKEPGTRTPEAMAKLLQSHRQRGSVSSETVLTAESIAFEHRDTETGNDLLAEIAWSWSEIGEFDLALENWDKVHSSNPARPAPDPLFSAIVENLVEHGEDGKVLTFVHSDRYQRSHDTLSRNARKALAKWFIGIGVPEEADAVLAELGSSNELDVRHIRAAIALQRNEPALALSLVSAEEDNDSLVLKARALSELGDHASASAIFEAASLESDARQEAWLKGNPHRLYELGMDPESEVMESLTDSSDRATVADSPKTQELANDVDQSGEHAGTAGESTEVAVPLHEVTLAESKALVARSRQTRELLSELLGSRVSGSNLSVEQ